MYAEEGRQRQVAELAVELYRERHRYLLSIARRNAINDADAQEALQEAFVSFMRKYDPGSGAPPLAWLTLALKRECWRKRRDAHLDRHVGQEAKCGGGESGTVLESIPARGARLEDQVAERDEARRRLARLKPDERTGLGLLAAGFSYKEIGRRRQWSYSKVNRCVTEGRAALGELAVAWS
jgi:RNA polymerase sigma factor (sigma-70 family)